MEYYQMENSIPETHDQHVEMETKVVFKTIPYGIPQT